MRPFYRPLLAAGLALLIAAPISATTISYGANNRPVLFEGVSLNGTNFDVTVVWGNAYNAVYATQPPMFLADETGALGAIQALVQALTDDGYTVSPLQSYLNVPYASSGTQAASWGVDLNLSPLTISQVNNATYQFYSNTGYTVWTVADPVKTQPTSWGSIKSLYQQ